MSMDSAHLLIVDGDTITITIPPPFVCAPLLQAHALVASGEAIANEMKVCIVGDELPPSLRSIMDYVSPPYVKPGKGTLSIALAPGNQTRDSDNEGNKMLLKGASFRVKFDVNEPAMMPAPPGPPLPDPKAVDGYCGVAVFTTHNTFIFSD